MAYKIEQVSDSLVVIKPKHWWNDPISSRDMVAALVEISKDSKVLSVCRLGSWSSLHLVVVEKR